CFVQATLLLFNHYKINNDLESGLAHLTQALKHAPLNESLLLQAMESHLAMDNKIKAIDLYNSACRSMKKKHNVGPGKPLRALALKMYNSA
ncbi:MAG TPA: hypothetical protein ENJ30_12915, partial [Desulfobulbaceae bacterium]|nr:hypothetical protein [Desulfobulbaceae bacterium]